MIVFQDWKISGKLLHSKTNIPFSYSTRFKNLPLLFERITLSPRNEQHPRIPQIYRPRRRGGRRRWSHHEKHTLQSTTAETIEKWWKKERSVRRGQMHFGGRLTKRTLQKSSRNTRNTITQCRRSTGMDTRASVSSRRAVQVMADDCPLLRQRSKHGPESGPHGFRCADPPLHEDLPALLSTAAKGGVCACGPRGFRRNRSKRHANHSLANDRFEEKALVNDVDFWMDALINWFSSEPMWISDRWKSFDLVWLVWVRLEMIVGMWISLELVI